MSFYNTTGLSSDQLRAAKDACNRQESHVLALFRKHVTLSPSEAHKLYGEDVPLTSIRRAITDLTERGLLMKCATMRRGAYGKPEHCWTLATGEPQAVASAEPQNFSPVSVPTEPPTFDERPIAVAPHGKDGEAREGTNSNFPKAVEPAGNSRGGRETFAGEQVKPRDGLRLEDGESRDVAGQPPAKPIKTRLSCNNFTGELFANTPANAGTY